MKKIQINPKTPEWMDSRALEDRSQEHMDKWLGVAYIRTEEYSEDTYADYVERMTTPPVFEIETEEEFNQRIAEQKKSWFEAWPDGTRYDIRILDGGSWDRTTWHGSFQTLKEAIKTAEDLTK